MRLADLLLHGPDREARARYDLAGLGFVFLALAVVLPARDFGQRDQLLSVLILPYVMAAAGELRLLGQARVVAGILAAVGICLKPQYVVIPLAVESYLLLRSRPRATVRARFRTLARAEPVIIVGAGVAYLAAIVRFTPLYFSVALPLLRQTYWAVGHLSVLALLGEAVELCVVAVAAVAVFVSSKERPEEVRLLIIAGVAASLAYLLQGTGWYYQQIPGLVLFGAALGLQLLAKLSDRREAAPRWLPPVAGSLGLLALALTTQFMGYPFTQDRAFPIETPDPSFFAGLAPGTPVAMLTTSVDDTMMPVERYGLVWGQRTNNLWLLPATLRSERPDSGVRPRRALTAEQVAALDATQKRWMVEDLQRWRPQVLLVKRCGDPAVQCQLLEDRHDDLLAWFRRDRGFADVWREYRLLRSSGPYDAYVLKTP